MKQPTGRLPLVAWACLWVQPIATAAASQARVENIAYALCCEQVSPAETNSYVTLLSCKKSRPSFVTLMYPGSCTSFCHWPSLSFAKQGLPLARDESSFTASNCVSAVFTAMVRFRQRIATRNEAMATSAKQPLLNCNIRENDSDRAFCLLQVMTALTLGVELERQAFPSLSDSDSSSSSRHWSWDAPACQAFPSDSNL